MSCICGGYGMDYPFLCDSCGQEECYMRKAVERRAEYQKMKADGIINFNGVKITKN